MVITVQLQLKPDAAQTQALEETLRTCNQAADWVSERAFTNKVFKQYALQKRHYRELRDLFPLLGAQAACLVFSKVADSYKLDQKVQRKFRPLGSVAFDVRNLKVHVTKQIASIWTVSGRKKIPFLLGDYQRELLGRGVIKQCDLVRRRDGRFFLMVAVSLPDEMELKATDTLGVDLGIAVIASDSDGNHHCGKRLNAVRHRNKSLREKLQRKGTKSAKRLLKKRSGQEHRFATNINHVISKRIVQSAKRTGRAIAIEDLNGIRRRIRARKTERMRLHSWSFRQLGEFITYKAQLAGVPIVRIDPKYTSQQCSRCGHTEKANRKTRSEFLCRLCGHSAHADTNGAQNIRLRGLDALSAADVITPNAEAIAPAKSGAVPICKSMVSAVDN